MRPLWTLVALTALEKEPFNDASATETRETNVTSLFQKKECYMMIPKDTTKNLITNRLWLTSWTPPVADPQSYLLLSVRYSYFVNERMYSPIALSKTVGSINWKVVSNSVSKSLFSSFRNQENKIL